MTAGMSRPLPDLRKALSAHGSMLWRVPPRTITGNRLHALRMLSAWRLTRVWLRTASSLEAALHDLPPVLAMGNRIHWFPLLSPPFEFDELDAVQMVLDAARLER